MISEDLFFVIIVGAIALFTFGTMLWFVIKDMAKRDKNEKEM